MAKESTASAGLKFKYVRALAGVKMSGAAFRVLMVYWDHARADLTNSHPKRETVWKEAAISPNSADSATKWLRANGWLTLQRKAVGTFANSYRLTVPEGIEWEGDSPKIGYPQGQDSPETGYPETGDSPKTGESTPQKLGTQTPQKLGSHNRPLNRPDEHTPPPTPTTPVEPEPRPATDGGGDSFQEFMKLLPSSKRKNPLTAQSIFAETINSGITAREVIDGTRAYVERENKRDDEGRGGKFISQAVKILEEEKWRPPILSPAEAIAEAGKIDRRMRELRDAGDDDGATAIFHAELKPIIDKHDLIRDEWGIGYRKKPKPFNPAEWSMS